MFSPSSAGTIRQTFLASLGIEDVDCERKNRRKLFGRLPEDLRAVRVSGADAREHLLCRKIEPLPDLGETRYSGTRAKAFGAPLLVVSDRASRSKANVPDLARVVVRSGVELPVYDDSRAKARAECHENQVLHAAPGTIEILRKRTRVCVVLHRRRHMEAVLEELDDRNIVPSRKVRRRHDHAALRIERPSAADSDRRHRMSVVACRMSIVRQFFNSPCKLVEDLLPGEPRRRELLSREYLYRAVFALPGRYGALRSAYV